MNLSEFLNTYLGKATDYDNAYGAQCVDLIKLYLDKVFEIKPGSWGNAKYYWIDFDKHPALKSNFKKISNTPAFVPKRGDIVVWNGSINNNCGHVAIAAGEGNTKEFYTYDQNWNGKEMKKVKHTYKNVYGVLRPINQDKVENKIIKGDFKVTEWKNGSTKETVYADTAKAMKIGELSPYESCSCLGKVDNMYLVCYKITGKSSHKTGFVVYHG